MIQGTLTEIFLLIEEHTAIDADRLPYRQASDITLRYKQFCLWNPLTCDKVRFGLDQVRHKLCNDVWLSCSGPRSNVVALKVGNPLRIIHRYSETYL